MRDFKKFYVICENFGRFERYDIMRYLMNAWKTHKERCAEFEGELEDDFAKKYYTIPHTREEYKEWVTVSLKYMYWSRTEYEIQLLPWPHNEKDIPKKVDIYWQCEMNMDLIVDIFLTNIEASTFPKK